MFRRKAGDLDGLAVGGTAASNVLVHAAGLGDKSGGAAARTCFLADTRPGRENRTYPLDSVQTALGRRSAGQHFPAGVPARFRTVGVVPALEARQVLAGWRCAVGAGICCLYRAMAGSEPPDIGSNVFAIELRRRVADRERPGGRWNLERISSSHAKCLPAAPLSPTRRDRLRRGAQARGDRFHSRGLPALSGPLRDAFHLLLGRGSAIGRDRRSGSRKEFRFPGLVSAGLLGPGTRPAQATARCLAVFLADPVLPGGVLRRFPASALSSSHRAGAGNSDRVRDFRSGEKEQRAKGIHRERSQLKELSVQTYW